MPSGPSRYSPKNLPVSSPAEKPEERNRFAIQAESPEAVDCADIEPQNSQQLSLQQVTLQRGWLKMDPFRIENRYPLGMFRAWSVIIPDAQCLVYPKPALSPPPLPKTGRGEFGAAHRGEGDHFHGLREFQPGDPLRRIAWRTSARHQKLYSRVMESPSEEACELNWYLMGGGDTEEKLSILAAWVLRAERMQIPYSLEMPGAALPADLGEEHRRPAWKFWPCTSHERPRPQNDPLGHRDLALAMLPQAVSMPLPVLLASLLPLAWRIGSEFKTGNRFRH